MNSKRFDVVILGLLAVSLGVNVWLWHSVRATRLRSGNTPASIGRRVPPLTAKALAGHDVTLDFSSRPRPTVLYVFSPSCGWCNRNANNLRALVEQRGNDYEFVGVSLNDKGTEDVQRYVAETGISFPVYARPSADTVRSYALSGTPQTIVVSRDGTVLKNWPGAYIQPIQKEVEDYFGLRLPGVEMPKDRAATAGLCVDSNGGEYSPGAVAVIAGMRQRCSSGGRWISP